MNFATFRQLNSGNIIRFLIIYNCFVLFEESYKKLVESKQNLKLDLNIQIKLNSLSIWWEARKTTSNVSLEEDQEKLKELVSLIEYV
jgi:hypothetical protein